MRGATLAAAALACWTIAATADSLRPALRYTVEHPRGATWGVGSGWEVWLSTDSGESWTQRGEGLPRRVVYPFDRELPRRITSLAVDPLDPSRVAVTTDHGLYASEDLGLSWREINTTKPDPEMRGWPKGASYFTSVALCPGEPERFLLGTSFNGFFETADDGESWSDPSEHALFLSRGAGFFEEIAAAAYLPSDPRVFAFGCGFGHSVYISAADRLSYEDLRFPGSEAGEIITGMLWVTADAAEDGPSGVPRSGSSAGSLGEGYALRVTTDRGLWYYYPEQSLWVGNGDPASGTASAAEADGEGHPHGAAGGRTGIYLNSYQARGERLENHLEWLAAHGLNSIVVDFKDDYGHVTYDTQVELAHAAGAVRARIDIEELLRLAHARGVYVIARIIVFKDQALYEYDGYRYAAWDLLLDEPWRHLGNSVDEETGKTEVVQREHWVDPYAAEVWEYNVALARELEARGIDEIQFDYIRFPTDGDLAAITYRHRLPGMSRIDALESFLALARSKLEVPISTDLYGFNSWHRMGNWNGQSIEMVADYVDVICPMFYPNHFPIQFLADPDYIVRAGRIYEEGCTRASQMVAGRALVRPYVQAFLLTAQELAMELPQYTSLLTRQIDGAAAAGAAGFTLWNPSNRYYMVGTSLQEYTGMFGAEPRPAATEIRPEPPPEAPAERSGPEADGRAAEAPAPSAGNPLADTPAEGGGAPR